MRVLHVIPSLSAVHGGPSAALPVMERALSAAGVAVETATTDDDGRQRCVDRPLGIAINENGVTRWYFPKQTEFYKVSLPLLRWLRREVHRFDLVHVHALFSFTSVAAAWTARRASVPYIIRPLGVLNRYGMSQRRALMKRVSFSWLEGPLLRDASAVHFTAAAEQAEAELLGIPMHSVVIPLGLEAVNPGNPEVFLSAFPTLRNRKRIVFLSRLDPKKNIESVLRALALVRAEFSDLSLIICGDGAANYVSSLKKLAGELAVEDLVTWLGQVEGPMKAAVLAAGDVFVLPSFSENFGLAALEAMAAGLPCILGKGVAIATEIEAVGAGAVVDSNPAPIGREIRAFLLNDALRQSARKQALILAERYSAANMGARLTQLYRSTLDETPGKHNRFGIRDGKRSSMLR
jgi:glycosyltransferase involved in cell wall biosynthesis